MLHKSTLVAALLCTSIITNAQTMMPCGADEHHAELLKKYPQMADMEEQFNTQLQSAARLYKTTTDADTVTYDIPVVVHVVHDYGPENISDLDIYNAVKSWTEVYMKQNSDTASVIPEFKPWIGNPKIRFHLATKDPAGNPTKGVVRHHTNTRMVRAAYDRAKFDPWPQNMYLNIWVVNQIYSATAMYGTYPADAVAAPYYDGIMVQHIAMNSPTFKYVPHELGHIFDVQHTWGMGNFGIACGDDHVDDTPPTKGQGNFTCITDDTACATGYQVNYTDIHGNDSLVDYPDVVNAQNIMEMPTCPYMFTKGQAARMRATLNSPIAGRNNLISPANLAATGALAPVPNLPPVADYTVSRQFLTANNPASFVFKNTSWNSPVSSILWTFSNGASISSAATTTVTNRFTVPGWTTVSLTATSTGGSNTITNNQPVYIADTVTTPVGYIQDFATPSSIDNWPTFNYYNNRFKWEYFNRGGVDDGSCMRYRSYDSTDRITDDAWGDYDDLISPAFDLTGDSIMAPLYLNFYTAAASSPFTAPDEDVFSIDLSYDGGATWRAWKTIRGTDLVNNGAVSEDFIPALPSEWKARSFLIHPTYKGTNVFFRFRYKPIFNSNNFYIDKIMLSHHPVGVPELLSSGQIFSIYPNPASSGFTLSFKTGNTGNASYTIRDITGKVVYEYKANFPANTVQQQTIDRNTTPAAGLYLITVNVDGNSSTQKLVVY